MIFTANFRKQHEETISIIKEISSYLTTSSLAENSQQVRTLLSTLIGKVNFHRAAEDNYLYPKLLNHESKELRTLAEKYYEGFINSKDTITNYSYKWASSTKIKDNSKEFIEDSKVIFNRMLDRIDKENNELFALSDKLL
ncbi:MAG: hemerythrin domain-containing protein [Sedimentibacter sp.]